MLIRAHDKPASDEETRAFLDAHDFGELIASGRGRDVPVVAPTHWVLHEGEVLVHFARENPIFAALGENPRAMLSVLGDVAYVPSDVNAGDDEPREWGVPTSYYGAVQLIGAARIVDDAAGMARILNALFARLQPEGGHHEVEPGDNPYARQFGGIRGVALKVEETRAKFKYGGNRRPAHRRLVERELGARGVDASVLDHLRRRP